MDNSENNSARGLVSAAELAAELGVTPACINKWRREGVIPAAVVRGHVVRFNRAEVMEILETPRECAPEFEDKRKHHHHPQP